MDLFSSYISVDTLVSDALLAEALSVPLPPMGVRPVAAPPAAEPSREEWAENFTRALKSQHARIRQFLETRRERWKEISARFSEQIERAKFEADALRAENDQLRVQIVADLEAGGAREIDSGRFLVALEEVRDLKARNAELQRQLLGQPGSGRNGEAVVDRSDWESQKRRFLAELDSEDGHDKESAKRRLEIEEIIERTEKIITEKNLEIEELKHLLDAQSGSIGSLALGAAALEQVFDQDEIICEERERLRLVEIELREKLRMAEIEHAMERARLARREMEIEERLRNIESHRPPAELAGEALAPTGRPVRGRWRTQMGLTDDDPPATERRR